MPTFLSLPTWATQGSQSQGLGEAQKSGTEGQCKIGSGGRDPQEILPLMMFTGVETGPENIQISLS